ncbi:MAG: ribonuclease Y [Planctomycetota bacterium]
MLYFIIGLGVGGLIGTIGLLVASRILGRRLTELARREADGIIAQATTRAENNAKQIELEAKQESLKLRDEAEEVHNRAELDAAKAERAAAARELTLDRRAHELDQKVETLERRDEQLKQQEEEIRDVEQEVKAIRMELVDERCESKRQLERISKLTEADAREMFLKQISEDCQTEAGEMIRKSLEQAQDEAKTKSTTILLEAIQKYAAEQTADHTVSTIQLADDAMKGRVIGREGRNIRSFEKATGVDVIIDDTPGVVGLSCFDPVRREIARVSLEKLVGDGRIHPGRIEEVVHEATTEMDEQLIDLGNQAAHNGHAISIPRQLYPLLGRLHFRTSYGQNVLKHSLEVAHLAQVMADELGLDGTLARRAGLLHDIGKAFDHESEGSHAELGAALLRKLGEPEAVVNAAAAHHGDVPATTPLTPIIMAADTISASRPGARRESLERYVKRLKDLEKLAADFKGVRQAYAIHAGREIRVIADAKAVDDGGSAKLARDIAKAIADNVNFPGEIKVTVLRETRSVELAR